MNKCVSMKCCAIFKKSIYVVAGTSTLLHQKWMVDSHKALFTRIFLFTRADPEMINGFIWINKSHFILHWNTVWLFRENKANACQSLTFQVKEWISNIIMLGLFLSLSPQLSNSCRSAV